MLDEPSKPFHWGNEGAAVAFKRVMERIINMDDSIVPPISNKQYETFEPNKIIASASKDNYDSVDRSSPLQLSTLARNSNRVLVPEVRGFSLRKTISILHKSGLKYKINGSGEVYWQHPRPGQIVKKGTMCEVGLK